MALTVEEFLHTLEDHEFLEILDRVGLTEFKQKNICPFHSEKTPSMMIRKHFYICWGCGSKGSVLKFIQELKGLSFMESVELVSNSLGLDVKFGRYVKAKDYDELYQKSIEVMDQEISQGNKVLIDLKERLPNAGFFSPDVDWQDQFALTNRAVLPIRTSSGKVVGFTGRALSDRQQPKWLHSTDLPVNYYLTKSKLKKLILVEGPGDAEAILKLIDDNSDWTPVSALGAHISLDHIKLMNVRDVVIMFDGDNAGRVGALQILRYNLDWRTISIATLPEGEDPGSITKEIFDEAMAKSVPLLDFAVARAEELMNTDGAIKHNQDLIVQEYSKRNGGLSKSELSYRFPAYFKQSESENKGKSISALLMDHKMGTAEVSVISRDVIYPLRLIATLSDELHSIPPTIKIGEVEYRMIDSEGLPAVAPLMDQNEESAEAILKGMYPELFLQLELRIEN